MGLSREVCLNYTPSQETMTAYNQVEDPFWDNLGKDVRCYVIEKTEPIIAKSKEAQLYLQDVYAEYYEKYRQFIRLNAIHYWSDQLTNKSQKVFNNAKRYFSENMDAYERKYIWQEVIEHYYLTGSVTYLPFQYRAKLEELGKCISAHESVQNKSNIRAIMPQTCVPESDSRRADAEWLVALLALHPEPISKDWLTKHVKSLLALNQLDFKKGKQSEPLLIYQIEIPNKDYLLTIELNDGYNLPKNDLQRIVGWVLALNECIPGFEVEKIVFQKSPTLVSSDGSVYHCSYYDASEKSVVIKIGPVAFDSITHEMGHALKDSYKNSTDPKIQELQKRLKDLFDQTLLAGALTLIKDSYYNPYNVNHDLLYRGHPEDDVSETAASLFNATSHYLPEYFNNMFGEDTPKEHQIAGLIFWQWQQDWLKQICPPEVLGTSLVKPWPQLNIQIPSVSILPKDIKLGEPKDFDIFLF